MEYTLIYGDNKKYIKEENNYKILERFMKNCSEEPKNYLDNIIREEKKKDAIDLIKKMIAFLLNERISIEEALNHAFFKEDEKKHKKYNNENNDEKKNNNVLKKKKKK